MWQWLRSKTPPKVEMGGLIIIEDRDLSEKKFRSILLKWMPHITKKDLDDIVEMCRMRGRVWLRLTKKAAKGLSKTKDIGLEVENLTPVHESGCYCNDEHGRYVCGTCARDLEGNAAWSETNIGLYPDDEGCRVRIEGTDDPKTVGDMMEDFS